MSQNKLHFFFTMKTLVDFCFLEPEFFTFFCENEVGSEIDFNRAGYRKSNVYWMTLITFSRSKR